VVSRTKAELFQSFKGADHRGPRQAAVFDGVAGVRHRLLLPTGMQPPNRPGNLSQPLDLLSQFSLEP
jgi:hypothetical protein